MNSELCDVTEAMQPYIELMGEPENVRVMMGTKKAMERMIQLTMPIVQMDAESDNRWHYTELVTKRIKNLKDEDLTIGFFNEGHFPNINPVKGLMHTDPKWDKLFEACVMKTPFRGLLLIEDLFQI